MSAALDTHRALGAREILALTLYGEAGDRPVREAEGVASVVMTRVRLAASPGGPAHLGEGVAGVCRAPFQFGCWHPGHPRRRVLAELPEGADLGACARIAARAIAGALPDPTGGATHYHDAARLPRWALGHAPTAELGGLVFYRLFG
ncbi:cell wall hydrolase [Falsiroseomonas oryziterrae]|uniref:cell wall hydrolase n=1 Tax=Falsiroseomonas oryziterrae TaxID=2911368 RepID=UPI001F3A8997|nr:cell wall hydrolase [Roseomonas sp. NPKOSM-4]